MLIQQELLDEATRLLKHKHEIPLIESEEDGPEFVHHQEWEGNGVGLNICEIRVDGVMPARFIEYFKNCATILPQINDRLQIERVDEDGDFKVYHQRYEMPFMINNRSFFTTHYHIEGCEPGEYQFIMSDHGNEKYAEKHGALASRNVVGFFHLNFFGVRPIRNQK